MRMQAAFLLMLLLTISSHGQRNTESFINSLTGRWVSTTDKNHRLAVTREGNYLLLTETTTQENGIPFITESKIYLVGEFQRDGVKPPAEQAKTNVGKSKLITIYYTNKNGKINELYRERLAIRNGFLKLTARMKTGIPFLAAQTEQLFIKSVND